MNKVLITGIGGLIGSAAAHHYLDMGVDVVGIDNNMRAQFFGEQGSVTTTLDMLRSYGCCIYDLDIRNADGIKRIVREVRPNAIIHCAAQPSHDRAASIPIDDFTTNALGTLHMLEAFRSLSLPHTRAFIHVSTNKVYGDNPNHLELIESEKRYDLAPPYADGIAEDLNVDQCTHSLFGVSKLSGDMLAQEYGRYFGLNVGVFRGGCLTGPAHAGVELHGFMSYIIKCAVTNTPYTVFGYKGKQVRDQIHCDDVISAFDAYINDPDPGAVYNIGGCRENSASVLETIDMLQERLGREFVHTMGDKNRVGDHVCYYSNMQKFMERYPEWKRTRSLASIVDEMLSVCISKHGL